MLRTERRVIFISAVYLFFISLSLTQCSVKSREKEWPEPTHTHTHKRRISVITLIEDFVGCIARTQTTQIHDPLVRMKHAEDGTKSRANRHNGVCICAGERTLERSTQKQNKNNDFYE